MPFRDNSCHEIIVKLVLVMYLRYLSSFMTFKIAKGVVRWFFSKIISRMFATCKLHAAVGDFRLERRRDFFYRDRRASARPRRGSRLSTIIVTTSFFYEMISKWRIVWFTSRFLTKYFRQIDQLYKRAVKCEKI